MKDKPDRKYRKRVNQSGWMIKLQKLCWGDSTPKFVGYCPFFWFTWLSLFLLPIMLPLRLILLVIVLVVLLFGDFKSTSAKRPKDKLLLSFYLSLIQTKEALDNDMERALDWERVHNSVPYAPVFRWIDTTPDWENCARRVHLRHLEREGQNEARKERIVVRSGKLRKIANYAGYVIKPLLIVASAVVLYWVGVGIMFVVKNITIGEIIFALKTLGVVLVLTAIITSVTAMLSKLAKWWRKCPSRPGRFAWAYKWALAVFNAIWGVLEFIAETIEIIYTRECPLIEWDSESGPIERQ